jgi:hypothetical protein
VGGVKNAFGAQVINAEAITPVVVGEGMKELENVTIGQEKREDISIAVGIPMSILFANAANYATSQQDELNYLTKTIIPDCEFIAAVLNEQLWEPLGLHMNFLPETLDAMQEDETARAASLQQLVNSGVPLLMAMDLLGYELEDEQRAALEQAEKDKQARAEEARRRLEQKPPEQSPQSGEEKPAEQQQPPPVNAAMREETKRWERKALNAIKKGKPANVDFESDIIPADVHEKVLDWLQNCQTAEEVRDIFINVNREAGQPTDVTALLEGIKLGVEALKVSE